MTVLFKLEMYIIRRTWGYSFNISPLFMIKTVNSDSNFCQKYTSNTQNHTNYWYFKWNFYLWS